MAIASTKEEAEELTAQLAAQVAAAVAASDLQLASELGTVALSRGLRHPSFFNARGLWLQESGRPQLALEDFQKALSLAPQDVGILNAIGLCYLKLERVPEAIESFEAAIAIDPDTTHTRYRKALALATAGNHEASQLEYENILAIAPDHVGAIASIASIAARKGETDKARQFANRALELDPHHPTALVALAILENSEKRYVEAERLLRRILTEGHLFDEARTAVLGLLGDALDGQKRYAEAFEIYCAENDELKRQHKQRFNGRRGIEAAGHLISYFESTPADIWKAPDDGAPRADGPTQHIFLLGFMRSGTTLLEQVLASNPRIVALEEKGLLNGLGEVFMTSKESLDTLANLHGSELERHRTMYWQRVRNSGLDVTGKIFVDKQPLNTTKLPLISKLFPQAKILFALRDPRDVVFSCFRRHFRVNVTMFEFLGLDEAARFYSSIMRLAEIYREKIPLNLFDHRYEDMVRDFEGRIRAVCEFIGVEWNDEMRQFNKFAPNVDIRSPSATQVRQPLYGEGIGQWRRYEEQLAPIFPILSPWVRKFGYPEQ